LRATFYPHSERFNFWLKHGIAERNTIHVILPSAIRHTVKTLEGKYCLRLQETTKVQDTLKMWCPR
jgi:hypothetical protein